jgi:anthranilate phosphoribosyltransferase
MVEFLKDFMPKMGTGTRSSEDLDYSEAREAMRLILEDDLDPVSFGAFVVAERWKSQTPEELAGFLDELRDSTLLRENREDGDRNNLLDVGGRFDGKVDSVNTEFAGSLLAVAEGARIVTHTGRNVPTQEGTTFLDVLDDLDWTTEPSPDLTNEALDAVGFTYTNPAVYAPGLDELRDLRRSLGVRCFLNTIESMMNPLAAKVHVGSFYHLSFATRVCETFDRCETQSPNRILMIQGIEGQTELRPGDCLMAEWKDGELIEHDLHTEELGLDFTRDDLETLGAEPGPSVEYLQNLVEGESVPPAYRQSVILNAACRLYAAGKVESVENGIRCARNNLEDGTLRSLWSTLEGIFANE